jgi:type IV pilus assembly protein PilC
MMISVVPKLVDIIDQAGGELPISTRILIFTSNALTNYWVLLIAITISLFFMARIYAGTNSGRRQFDMIKLYIPVFGKLFRKIYIVRFSRALNTLMVGGVNITKALDITSETVGNEIYKEILLKTSEEVTNGNSISTVFSESHLVPVMVSQIMQVGEQTGRLEEVLDKITDFYTLEIDNTVRNLVSLLEPLIIVVMGGGVGLLVASIILPIYQVATSF